MHEDGIVHADTGCHDMSWFMRCLKIVDVEGCSIHGKEAGAPL